MSSKNFRYSHIYSAVDGKTPSADTLYTAEIAINAYPHNEHLFIKNSSGNVVSFDTAEEIDAKLALKLDASAYTPIEVSSAVTSGDTNPVQGGAVYEVIADNELVISNALNALDEKKLDASAYTPVDLSNYYAKNETSGATELTTEFAKYYTTAQTSSKTEIDDALALKLDIDDFQTYSGAIDTALSNKQDVSGMTAYTQNTAFTAHTADTTIHHTATSAVTSGSSDVLTSGGAYSQLGGLKLLKLTQSQYDALSPNYDASTVYIIVD